MNTLMHDHRSSARRSSSTPGDSAAFRPWTVAATPAEEERNIEWRRLNDEEADVTRTLKSVGGVGVRSMVGLADLDIARVVGKSLLRHGRHSLSITQRKRRQLLEAHL